MEHPMGRGARAAKQHLIDPSRGRTLSGKGKPFVRLFQVGETGGVGFALLQMCDPSRVGEQEQPGNISSTPVGVEHYQARASPSCDSSRLGKRVASASPCYKCATLPGSGSKSSQATSHLSNLMSDP